MMTKVSDKQFKGVNAIFTLPTTIAEVVWDKIITKTKDPREEIIKHILRVIKCLKCVNISIISNFFHIEHHLASEILKHLSEQGYIEELNDQQLVQQSIAALEKLKRKGEIFLDLSNIENLNRSPFFKIGQKGEQALSSGKIWLFKSEIAHLKFPNLIRKELGLITSYLAHYDEEVFEEIDKERFEFYTLMDQRQRFNIPDEILEELPNHSPFYEKIEGKGFCEVLVRKNKFFILLPNGREVSVDQNHPDIPPLRDTFSDLPDERSIIKNYLKTHLNNEKWYLEEIDDLGINLWGIGVENASKNEVRKIIKRFYELDSGLVTEVTPVTLHIPISDTNWRLHFRVRLDKHDESLLEELHNWELMKKLEGLDPEVNPEKAIEEYNLENNCQIRKEQLREFLFEFKFWDALNNLQVWEDIINE